MNTKFRVRNGAMTDTIQYADDGRGKVPPLIYEGITPPLANSHIESQQEEVEDQQSPPLLLIQFTPEVLRQLTEEASCKWRLEQSPNMRWTIKHIDDPLVSLVESEMFPRPSRVASRGSKVCMKECTWKRRWTVGSLSPKTGCFYRVLPLERNI